MIAPAIREDLFVRNPYNERVNACDTINGRAHGEIARSLPPRNMRLPEVSIATPFGRTGELKSVARSSRVRVFAFGVRPAVWKRDPVYEFTAFGTTVDTGKQLMSARGTLKPYSP